MQRKPAQKNRVSQDLSRIQTTTKNGLKLHEKGTCKIMFRLHSFYEEIRLKLNHNIYRLKKGADLFCYALI